MALETGTYISDLVSTNPPGTDSKSQGDDHIRLIKSVLQATLPGANRAFNLTRSAEYKDATDTLSANTTLVAADLGKLIRVDATSGDVTITLPDPTSDAPAGWVVTLKRVDAAPANELKIVSAGSGTIEGVTDYFLLRQTETVSLRSDGTNWHVTGGYLSDVFSKGEIVGGNKTVVLADYGKALLVDASSGAVTITLGLAATLTDEFFIRIVKTDSSANAVTIARSGSDLINGVASIALTRQYDWAVPQSNGMDWIAITSITPLPPFQADHLTGFELRNSTTDVINDIVIGAGTMRNVADTRNVILAADLTKRGDAEWAEGSGQGGRFNTAAFAANTDYYWVVISKNSDPSVIDAGFDTAVGIPNLPAGWTVERRIGVRRTKNASAAWQEFKQDGDMVTLTATEDVDRTTGLHTSGGIGAPTAVTINNVPVGVELKLFGTLRFVKDDGSNAEAAIGMFHHATTAIASIYACQIAIKIAGQNERRVTAEVNELWCSDTAKVQVVASGGPDLGDFHLRGWTDRREKKT